MARPKVGETRVTIVLSDDLRDSVDEGRGKTPRATFVRQVLERAVQNPGGLRAAVELNNARVDVADQQRAHAIEQEKTMGQAILDAAKEHRHARLKTMNGGGWMCKCGAQSWNNGATWIEP